MMSPEPAIAQHYGLSNYGENHKEAYPLEHNEAFLFSFWEMEIVCREASFQIPPAAKL